MRTPSQAGRHLPEGRTHPRRQVFSHNGVPDGKALYRQVAALKDGLSARADPFGVAAPLLHAQLAWLMHPQELSERMASLTTDLWQLRWHSFHRSVGLPSPDPVQPHADDPRFADPVWTESPTWDLVKVTPWINKFYVLDLHPKKSMVRYLLDQGVDVFITSWKNPDESMRAVSFDDYIRDGVDAIVRVARDFSGADKVHAVGYCIGGTALAIYMAWAARHFGEEAVPVRDWTLLTTLVDFHTPGDIEVFIDEGSVAHLTAQMQRKGYLDGKDMASSFRLLRSNSLVWHYVMHGWLYGEAPAPFDVLHWSMDTTRMPYAMHAWYLRELYLNNRLIQPGALTVAGELVPPAPRSTNAIPALATHRAPTCTSLEAPCGAARPDSDRIHQPRLTHFFISTGGTQNAHASCFDRTFTEPGHHRVSRKHGQQRVRTALGLQRLDYPAQAHHRGSGG